MCLERGSNDRPPIIYNIVGRKREKLHVQKIGKWRRKWKPPWWGPWSVTWEGVRERRKGKWECLISSGSSGL